MTSNSEALIVFVLSIAASLVLHVAAGWVWSAVGGALIGFLRPKGGWLLGAAVVGISWAILVLYNTVTDYPAVSEMHRVFADFAYGGPGWTTGLLSVLIGVVLGATAGLLGSSLARLVESLTETRKKPSH